MVAEVDDTYVYHTHLGRNGVLPSVRIVLTFTFLFYFIEIMPRIVYHLDFLKANPDIKIMVRILDCHCQFRTSYAVHTCLRANVLIFSSAVIQRKAKQQRSKDCARGYKRLNP